MVAAFASEWVAGFARNPQAVVEAYGGVERLQVRELEPPGEPGTGEVLVRVRASSVNPLDSKIRRGQLRFVSPAKLPLIPGFDLAGEVEAQRKCLTFREGEPSRGESSEEVPDV
jgi:NADPH:quinone reductase-like Zn-dependent oxidoreductase